MEKQTWLRAGAGVEFTNGRENVYNPDLARINPGVEELLVAAESAGEGILLDNGVLVVETGKYTGRSPKDKFYVEDEFNIPLLDAKYQREHVFEREKFERLHRDVTAFLADRPVFVQQLHAGADPDYRLPVEIVTQKAWHSLFARNLFINPRPEELVNFQPAFTVINASEFEAKPEIHGTKSETFILLDLKNRQIVIGGTSYAGEIKKGIFTVMNHFLPMPEVGVMPMHCSCNYDEKGRVSLFFGLSGTGKTTLSADPLRRLIGDDEHGWNGNGVFNFEGGCYAKVINFDAAAEPEIAKAINGFGTILENVIIDSEGTPNFFDDSKTENTRAAYSSESIEQMDQSGMAGHPDTIFFLSADTFGALPPIAKLTPEQAVEFFLAGYTAKLAGTERGITTPQETFSACFGQPFLTHPPHKYAILLKEKLEKHGSQVWMVNTGWIEGYGNGPRISIDATRALIRAAQDGVLEQMPMRTDKVFGFEIPESCPGVDPNLLLPRDEAKVAKLKLLFDKAINDYKILLDEEIKKAAIK